MANTKNITVGPDDGWVEVPVTGVGLLTASKAIEYCQYTGTPPEELVGHHLRTMNGVRFDVSTEPLWVKASTETVLIVTES